MIISRTPLRISLVGGGTDMPAFYEQHPGTVASFAINKYVYVIVNQKFDDKYRISYSKTENSDSLDGIKHDLIRETLREAKKLNGMEVVTVADIPGSGTGLGSSSAVIVGLLNCFYKEQSSNWLAETAFDIEAKTCRKPVGKQDHYIAALGGFNLLQFSKKKIIYSSVESRWDCENPWSQNDLEKKMLLLWTGMTRSSSDILQKQKDGFSNGKNTEFGVQLSNLAHDFHGELINGEIKEAAKLISVGWEIKKNLSPWISNDFIDNWYKLAMQNGAWGGKLLGAGGGGFLFFLAPPETHSRIIKATGLQRIGFKIENRGSEVIYEA